MFKKAAAKDRSGCEQPADLVFVTSQRADFRDWLLHHTLLKSADGLLGSCLLQVNFASNSAYYGTFYWWTDIMLTSRPFWFFVVVVVGFFFFVFFFFLLLWQSNLLSSHFCNFCHSFYWSCFNCEEKTLMIIFMIMWKKNRSFICVYFGRVNFIFPYQHTLSASCPGDDRR